MVIPPSLPSIIRKTDWSILRKKKDWILHNFERHFSNITNRHSFPFNTDCLLEYQTSPLTNSPPDQSSQNASQQVISTNKKRTLDCSNVLFWGTQQIRTAVHGFADRYLATRSGYRCCLFASAKLKLYFHSTKLFGKKYLFLSKIWQTHIVKDHYFSYLWKTTNQRVTKFRCRGFRRNTQEHDLHLTFYAVWNRRLSHIHGIRPLTPHQTPSQSPAKNNNTKGGKKTGQNCSTYSFTITKLILNTYLRNYALL